MIDPDALHAEWQAKHKSRKALWWTLPEEARERAQKEVAAGNWTVKFVHQWFTRSGYDCTLAQLYPFLNRKDL